MKISILTATYKAAEHLPSLIERLRPHTDRVFERIVMDGGPRGNTAHTNKLTAEEKYIQ